MIPTIEEVRSYLRDDESSDEALQLLLDASVSHVKNIIDGDLPDPIPKDISVAILITCGGFHSTRESIITGTIVAQNPAVMHLLSMHRKGIGA